MPPFLILKLDGVMQSWGDHSYENYRPSRDFPTRSALLGLLAACLGIDRSDISSLKRLQGSVHFTVRADSKRIRDERGRSRPVTRTKMRDYHTVLHARRASRDPRQGETIETEREYLNDAVFTVVVEARANAPLRLEDVRNAVLRPIYTPFLGRRACPLSRPLFEAWNMEAPDALVALAAVAPTGGSICSETIKSGQPMQWRDEPLYGRTRRFASRELYLLGGRNVAQ